MLVACEKVFTFFGTACSCYNRRNTTEAYIDLIPMIMLVTDVSMVGNVTATVLF